MEKSEGKVEMNQDSISPSFSYDGYEQLHDDAMDKISVSIRFSDEALSLSSRTNLTKISENCEKKMKISLSQEQLKLKSSNGNFLSVPRSSRKLRSSSFSVDTSKSSSVDTQIQRIIDVKAETFAMSAITVTPPVDVDEIIYAVPRRSLASENSTSTAVSAPQKSVASEQAPTPAQLDSNAFKYPLSFYCKICNEILNDPRTLDCLHSFCLQCLMRLDVSNDLQNNQFWRTISRNSESSCEFIFMNCVCLFNILHHPQVRHHRIQAWNQRTLTRQNHSSPEV